MDADTALGFLVPVLNLSKRLLHLEKSLSPPALDLMALLPLCPQERKDSNKESHRHRTSLHHPLGLLGTKH